MIYILHFNAENEHQPFNVDQAVSAMLDGKYVCVADYKGYGLEGAWQATQNIESAWVNNKEEFSAVHVERCRSSMIGDIFAIRGDGLYMVDIVGFTKFDLGKRI